jgi:hypothetical protein
MPGQEFRRGDRPDGLAQSHVVADQRPAGPHGEQGALGLIGVERQLSGQDRYPLSDWPDYAAFAETALRQAAARVRAIHDLTLPYAADKAFALEESPVIARAARVGLDRDETWVPPVLDELFRKASVAPNSAKTLPSQSVAIALGHAVEAFPTPEAVTTLREVVREVRHAGIKKKLQRNLRGAEFGLADRPEIALRLPLDQPMRNRSSPR